MTAGGGGGSSSTSTTSSPTMFFPGGQQNSKPDPSPHSALVVYVPPSSRPNEPIGLSPANGYDFKLTEDIDRTSSREVKKADVTMVANLPNGVNVSMPAGQQRMEIIYDGTNEKYYATNNGVLWLHTSKGYDVYGNPLLTDATFGIAEVNEYNTGAYARAAFHTGTPTPVGEVPTNITATYRGQFMGDEIWGGNRLGLRYTSDMSMTADFSAGTVKGKIDSSSGISGINFDGRIAGNAFGGTASYSRAGSVTTSGVVNGAFYGSNATQTAGAVQVQGIPDPNNTTVGTMTVNGSFGARR